MYNPVSSIMSSLAPHLKNEQHHYTHFPQSILHIMLVELFKAKNKSILYPLSYMDNVELIQKICKSENISVFTLPFYDLLPYEDGIVSPPIIRERLQTLFAIIEQQKGIYLINTKSFLFPVLSQREITEQLSFTLELNITLEYQVFIDKLILWGYERFSQVEGSSQFSVKGEMIEIWDPFYNYMHRIYWEDSQVTKIVIWDPAQSSSQSIHTLLIHALYDFIYTPKRHEKVLERFRQEKAKHQIEYFNTHQIQTHLINMIPFFCKTSLLDLFTDSGHPYHLVLNNLLHMESLIKNWDREIKELYTSSFNSQKIMLSPDSYHLGCDQLIQHATDKTYITPFVPEDESEKYHNMSLYFKENTAYKGKVERFIAYLENLPKGLQVVLVVKSQDMYEKITTIFPKLPIIENDLLEYGILDYRSNILWVTERDLFDHKSLPRKQNSFFLDDSEMIESISQLNAGDYVVHMNHGIGIYEGIEKMAVMGVHKDYIKITYADEETLYISIEQIALIHKYLGNSNPTLNNIGGKKWEQKKAKVTQQLEDISEDLVILYETRKKSAGFPFPEDSSFQEQFESSFPYNLTEGQAQAIHDVKKDMEAPFVMDRLICGDVGYGKTEVAMRAIFKAVSAGKQVAFLAPTTLLVEQHYRTLVVRFSDFPINIKMMSRVITPKEKQSIKNDLKEGVVDVIIGTHAIFSSQVQFKDLGLLVIDEEQRFGVKHKENIKDKNPLVDTLTLSATPIPRTLYMGLSSFRDMSLILTPPTARLAIKTYVMPFNEEVMISAINREIERHGQIFMIHNRVKTIGVFADFIQKLCPHARILVGHAQMNAQEMEHIFLDFIAHKADILISTTIIESGIDIPNTNTIIIDKPELFGLGELYQLRGRVGRSKRQGYAYLFYDAQVGLTPQMQQRLETIEENNTLGSGFQIALRDLEIRGAGNLLGKAQSGLFDDVGIEMYSRILKKVIHKIKGNPIEEIEPVMDLPFEGHIPATYIPLEQERFLIYKKLMQLKDESQLKTAQSSIIENYGTMVPAMDNLFQVSRIKILSRRLNIKELRCKNQMYELYFGLQPDIQTPFLVPYIQGGKAKILNTQAITIQQGIFDSDILQDITHLLEALTPKNKTV